MVSFICSRLLSTFTMLALPAVFCCAPAVAADANSVPDTIAQRVLACTTCHGKQGIASNDGIFPRIAGKPQGYLFNQLRNFRDGRRQYPPMNYLLAHLSDAYLHEIAAYFSEQHPPYPPSLVSDAIPAVLARGRALVLEGDPGRQIPACIACHGRNLSGLSPGIPGLLGLPRDYINAQFGAWRNGVRHAQAPDCMEQISTRLSLEDINAVSHWLAGQSVPAATALASTTATPLPLSCGSNMP